MSMIQSINRFRKEVPGATVENTRKPVAFHTRLTDLAADLQTLAQYLPKGEHVALNATLRSGEGAYTQKLITETAAMIRTMPELGSQDGRDSTETMVYMHYFKNGSDWWITELGSDEPEESRLAFGFVCLNGWADCAELGYIEIGEIILCGAELDLHWTPVSLKSITLKVKGD